MNIDFKTKGKVPADKANTLLNSMLIVAEVNKVELKAVLEKHDINALPVYSTIYHRLRNAAEYDMQYDDSHPAYSPWEDINGDIQPGRKRIVPFCGWSVSNDYYGNGVNDTHWLTVQKQVKERFTGELIKIVKEVGL